MIDFSAIPWLGVLLCMIVAIVSGSIWYGPKTFFPVLSVVLHALHPDGYTWAVGAQAGILFWLAFVMPTYLVNKLFAGHPLYVWGIEIGNHLVNFVLFGIILSFFA